MYTLARFLLSPIDWATYQRLPRGGPPDGWRLPLQLDPYQPPDMTKLPIQSDTAHRLAGHEAILARTPLPLVFVYPQTYLAGSNSGYKPDESHLKDRMTSLISHLLSGGTIAVDRNRPPGQSEVEDVWLAGHSAGNSAAWTALGANAADVGRVIAIDPTAGATIDLHDHAENTRLILKGAIVRSRAAASSGLRLIVIASPNATPAGVQKALDNVKADPQCGKFSWAMLPPLADQASFWNPSGQTNKLLSHILGQWDAKRGREINSARRARGSWTFLFFHEFTAYGGRDFDPTHTPAFTTFLEEALQL
jgi:hypothetical protein